MKREPKNERGGRKETLADKLLDFENLRLPVNVATDWLGQSNNIVMCQSKVWFHTERSFMVCDMHAVIVL